ncbi:dipeptidase [Rubrivirga sp. S365]|uniref:Dipeptidase n=1 Tax=Rubrivirga litoralis TaxID=3075598 RepID=A0ABU3BNX4_9BACT|nr:MULTISPECIES: dipeptidase [unclassified Rubrivirga]MDT0630988.1 dipeptidase [Rubrivirga sp. F394]MDT7858030.1 dipeptidase [Rubrivirga sp. S365]
MPTASPPWLRAAVLLTAALAGAACADAPRPAPSAPPARPSAAIRLPDAAVRRLVAEDPLWADALRIHYDAVVVDGHVDTPSLMVDEGYAFGERHAPEAGRAHVDLPRMVEGGLDAAFFALYVSRTFGEGPEATARALLQADEIERQVAALDGAEVARTAADVRRLARAGRTAVLLGLEGGHALQASPEVLQALVGRGVRYVTLTHTNTNAWADASTDSARWGGLNETGRALVREMNRLGVLVDLSHVSDEAFYDALETTEAPVILSHSSARALHDHVRNVTDDMLRAVADNGGVVLVNFYPEYVGSGRVTTGHVLDHIEHIARVAGVDHVGLGSDFDGVPTLPEGLEDVTRLPWVTYGLLRRGFSEADVRKILGENALRVLEAAERVAEQ